MTKNLFAGAVVLVLTAAGAARVIATYPVFSHTWDETAHVACGMEWLEKGTFRLEMVTPPLGRVATAIGPFLSGIRSQGRDDVWVEGDDILHANGTYRRNLALSRAGVLPFFVLATLVMYGWSRRCLPEAAGVVAVFLFSTTPTILAHSGLATVDVAFTATFTAAILAFVLWLDDHSRRNSLLLGLAVGLSVLSKFSAILFIPACFGAIAVARAVMTRWGGALPARSDGRVVKSAGVAILTVFLVVWAGYRFSVGTMKPAGEGPYEAIDRCVGNAGVIHDLSYAVVEKMPIPAPELIPGINSQREHNAKGHLAYFMGEVRDHGWWYFFVVSLFLKTPIPFLVLALCGLHYTIRRGGSEGDWRYLVPGICCVTLLLAGSIGNLNLGVRYILPIYPALALLGGAGAYGLWTVSGYRLPARLAVAALLVWQLASGIRAHPDYLPYANEFAGAHPEDLVVESDFDWGQDVSRLDEAIRRLGIKEISVCVRGAGFIERNLSAVARPLVPHERVTGWVAISATRLKYDGTAAPPYDGYRWLAGHVPVMTVGRTIKLFRVEGAGKAAH